MILAAKHHSGDEDRCYSEKFRNFVACAEPDRKNSIFRIFRGSLRPPTEIVGVKWRKPAPTYAIDVFSGIGDLGESCIQPTGNSFTLNQWYRWKAETLKACLLLVWSQGFSRYRPWKVPKSGHVTIRKIEKLHIGTRRKFTDSKNAILFDLRQK